MENDRWLFSMVSYRILLSVIVLAVRERRRFVDHGMNCVYLWCKRQTLFMRIRQECSDSKLVNRCIVRQKIRC